VFYDLYEATIEQIKIGGWVMIPLVILSLWMWFLIAKKLKDHYSFTTGDRSASECIRTWGTDKFSSAIWQKEIIDGYLKERTDNDEINQSILLSLRLPLEQYLKRVRALEEIANSNNGVKESYALQAGREIRIFVKPEDIDDLAATRLARDISKQIEETMQYPGQIKVTVIRETRAVDYAK